MFIEECLGESLRCYIAYWVIRSRPYHVDIHDLFPARRLVIIESTMLIEECLVEALWCTIAY